MKMKKHLNMKYFVFFLLFFLISYSIPNKYRLRYIAGSRGENPKINPLIDNRIAMKARNDVWNNPEVERIYLSTYEFEEDTIGLSQVKWAVEQAKKGKTVDIVLDDAGHKLSNEVLLYMTDNGVNVHTFSPMWSWRGFKGRLSRQQKNFKLTARIQSIWRQLTYRMHDKILINFVPGESTGGEVILGGRNARDSHYGIDTRIIRSVRKEKGKKIDVTNGAFEYEHEVMVHDKNLHQEVQTYVDDFLESNFTERINTKKLREKMQKSREYAKKHGESWRTKLASDKMNYDDDFRAFAKDMKQWISSYSFYYENKTQNPSALAQKLANVFSDHSGYLAKMIRYGSLDIKELDRLMHPLYGESASEVMRKMYGDFLHGQGRIKAIEIADALVTLTREGQKTIADNIRTKNLTPNHLNGFLGPFASKKLREKIKQSFKNFFFGIGFDYEKYDQMEKILSRAEENFREFQSTAPQKWKNVAQEVDSVRFLHDTVDDIAFRKKSMDELYKMISNCRKNCVWNSQYGSLTIEAQNAIENVVKQNSVIYRFVQSEFRKPGGQKAANEKAKKFTQLVRGNIETIQNNLSNPHLPQKAFKEDIEDLGKQFIEILSQDRLSKNQAKQLIKDAQIKKITPQQYAKGLYNLVKKNQKNIADLIHNDADKVERALLKMKGFIDFDPKGILPAHEMIPFYFMTNDVDSWAVGLDKVIHADFHYNIMKKFRRMGPGLHVVGMNGSGRIHSKVVTTDAGLVVSSMNADPRSEKFNTEVGIEIKTQYKGQNITDAFRSHIESYMHSQRYHIVNGQLVRPRQCFNMMTNVLRWITAPIL